MNLLLIRAAASLLGTLLSLSSYLTAMIPGAILTILGVAQPMIGAPSVTSTTSASPLSTTPALYVFSSFTFHDQSLIAEVDYGISGKECATMTLVIGTWDP